MRTAVVALLMSASLATAGPVPRGPQPDPLGRGYMGVYPVGETITISQIDENTPAAAAGLKAGDVFVRVGDVEAKRFDEIVEYVKALRPGTRIRITVRRGSEEVTVVLRLMARAVGT